MQEFETKNEKAWATVEKLRIEKDDIQAELDNEIDQVALWKQEHSISKAAQERQTKDFTTKNQQLAFELEKMKAENDRLQKQNDLLERERDELRQSVSELEDELSSRGGGEFIQFTESKLQENLSTVHEEFSRNEEYLKAKDDEIHQMRQVLDDRELKNRQLQEQLEQHKQATEQYKKELNCLESINKKMQPKMDDFSCQAVDFSTTCVATKSLSRSEKLLTITVVLLAILVGIEYLRDEPWLLINCHGFGKSETY